DVLVCDRGECVLLLPDLGLPLLLLDLRRVSALLDQLMPIASFRASLLKRYRTVLVDLAARRVGRARIPCKQYERFGAVASDADPETGHDRVPEFTALARLGRLERPKRAISQRDLGHRNSFLSGQRQGNKAGVLSCCPMKWSEQQLCPKTKPFGLIIQGNET